jgi:galactose mutarotase-like enzyme
MTVDTLRNEHVEIAVKRLGAELTSITDADGIEYLWQGDPVVWGGQSPILFPIVGRLTGDSHAHAGDVYALPQHGFARRKSFRLIGHSNERLAYALSADDSSRKAYPFDFDLTLSYELDRSTIRVGYRVTNPGSTPLPFSLGGHPGFSCSWHAGDALEDYFLEFERAETADTCLVRDGLIAVNETRRILTDDRLLPLTRTLFDSGALVFRHLSSSAVTLRSRQHPNRVRVDFPGFPCLGIWSKPAAPFVCIEPWFGHADPVGRSPGSPLETKPGMIVLPPNRSFACGWQMSLSR